MKFPNVARKLMGRGGRGEGRAKKSRRYGNVHDLLAERGAAGRSVSGTVAPPAVGSATKGEATAPTPTPAPEAQVELKSSKRGGFRARAARRLMRM